MMDEVTPLFILQPLKKNNGNSADAIQIILDAANKYHVKINLNHLSKTGATAFFYAINSLNFTTANTLLNAGCNPLLGNETHNPLAELNDYLSVYHAKLSLFNCIRKKEDGLWLEFFNAYRNLLINYYQKEYQKPPEDDNELKIFGIFFIEGDSEERLLKLSEELKKLRLRITEFQPPEKKDITKLIFPMWDKKDTNDNCVTVETSHLNTEKKPLTYRPGKPSRK